MQLCNRVIDKSTLIAILGSKPATGIRGATRSMRGEALFRSKRLISRFFHFHSGGGKLDSILLFVSLLVSILPANQPSSPIRRRCISLEGDSSGSPSTEERGWRMVGKLAELPRRRSWHESLELRNSLDRDDRSRGIFEIDSS